MARLSRAASTSTSDPSLVPSMRGATRCVAGWRCWAWCGADSTASTPSTSAAAFRSGPLGQPGPRPERFARELAPLLEAIPGDRQPRRLAIEPGRFLVARAGWLVARVLHVRDRPGAERGAPGRARRRNDGADPTCALRRPPRDRGVDLAPPSCRRSCRRSIARPTPPPSSRGPCASRPTTSARTICRRFDAATSSPSATRARTRRRSARPTTAGRARRRSCSRRTARSGSFDGAGASPTWADCRPTSGGQHRRNTLPPCRHAATPSPGSSSPRSSPRGSSRSWRPCLPSPRHHRKRRSAVSCLRSASDPGAPADAPPPGPPFPEPEIDRAVYDFAGVFEPETIPGSRRPSIDRGATKAEVVVYTQVVDSTTSTEETERHARALIDQWGVGRSCAGGDAWRTSAEYADRRGSPVRHQGAVVARCADPRRRDGASRSRGRPAAHARSRGGADRPRHGGAPRRRRHPDHHARRRSHRGADRQPAGRLRTARRRSWAVDHRRPGQDLLEAELADSSSAVDPGLLVLVEQDPSGSHTEIVYAATPEFQADVPEDTLQQILADSVDPVLDAGDLNAATIVAVARPLMELSGELPGGPARTRALLRMRHRRGRRSPNRRSTAPSTTSPASSSPRRLPRSRRRSIASRSGRRPRWWSTRRSSTPPRPRRPGATRWRSSTSGASAARASTMASRSSSTSSRAARAGRSSSTPRPGFAATFLTNSERQQIFENDMLPHLREDDWDGGDPRRDGSHR